MSNSKNYNSIVFLTTLSVYLGLVLVGATPPVLAQAALTQKIEIQNEIEIKDDLDKNPDREDLSAIDIPALFVEFLNEIKVQANAGKVNSPLLTNFAVGSNYESHISLGGGSGFGGEVADVRLKQVVQDIIEKKIQSAATNSANYYNSGKSVTINLNADSTEWVLSVNLTENNANKFAEFLNKNFLRASQSAKDALTRKIYKNTSAEVNSLINQRVSIIIHLPRSAIDEFLAEKDAN